MPRAYGYNDDMHLLSSLLIIFLLLPGLAAAQVTLAHDEMTFSRAVVADVRDERTVTIPGTDTLGKSQTLTAHILDGTLAGRDITFENDYIQLAIGDTFYLRHIRDVVDGIDRYSVADPYRLPVLVGLLLVFLVALFLFGGMQGIRGLASLLGSIVLIMLVLMPGILAGYSPALVSIGVAGLIIILGSYITHGFNRATSAAVFGMLTTVVITGGIAYLVTDLAHLSGYTSEENTYLNFDTRGAIDMPGLLFGGIVIGLLGVLYDISIGQAIAVEELLATGTGRAQAFARSLRIGREHIGALVNTLAIAYVGAALPLLLLISHSSDSGVLFILNSELFATEIIRILIGSLGLVLAVPVTTLFATYLLEGKISGGHSHRHA